MFCAPDVPLVFWVWVDITEFQFLGQLLFIKRWKHLERPQGEQRMYLLGGNWCDFSWSDEFSACEGERRTERLLPDGATGKLSKRYYESCFSFSLMLIVLVKECKITWVQRGPLSDSCCSECASEILTEALLGFYQQAASALYTIKLGSWGANRGEQYTAVVVCHARPGHWGAVV